MKRLIIGISGSSAPILGIRLLEALQKNDNIETHLVLSPTVEKTLHYEAKEYSIDRLKDLVHFYHEIRDLASSISSGSFKTMGMVVMPCSMRSLSAIAHGFGDNLLTRAADVCLKERRKLILVPRETPLNLAHLKNMLSVTEMGGIILPPSMAFYHSPQNVIELVDHVVGKVLDVLDVPHRLYRPWKENFEKTNY